MPQLMYELVDYFNDLVDLKNNNMLDEQEKGEMRGIKEAFRACGYKMKRDENGHVVALYEREGLYYVFG